VIDPKVPRAAALLMIYKVVSRRGQPVRAQVSNKQQISECP